MKTVGSRELKNHLGAYLRQVREGTTIIVTDRGTPIAELRALTPLAGSEAAALARLTADGLVSPPTRSRLTADYEPLQLEGGSLSATVVADREDRI